MPKELTPYVANAIGIMITNKPGNSPYSIVSQKTFTEEVQNVSEVADKIADVQTNIEKIDQLLETIETVKNIKADIQTVEENASRIQNNLEAIEANTASISSINSSISSAESRISNLESSIAGFNSKDEELDLGIQSNLALIESYAEDGGEIDQHIDNKLVDYMSISSYSADQSNKAAAYSNLYQTKAAAEEDKIETVGRLDSLDSSVSEINGNIDSISSSLSTKADQSSVRSNTEAISNLSTKVIDEIESAVESHSSAISEINSQVALIANTVSEQSTSIETNGEKIASIEDDIDSLQSDVSSHSADIASISETATGNKTAISAINTQISSNSENITLMQDRVSTLENAGYLTKNSFSQGLYRLQGDTSTSSAKHTITTKKNGKNITSMLWNESSGGGAMITNENAGKKSFIGVNNGDGDNEIWVQGYAKNIANNTGARITLSTEGFYYTKNQNNGSYTNLDEVLTKRDANSIRMVIDSAILDFKMQLVNAGIATLEQLGLQSGTIDPGSGSGPIEEEDF